jgi:hypothetical protein
MMILGVLVFASVTLFAQAIHNHDEHIGTNFIKTEIRRAISFPKDKLIAEINTNVSIMINL